MFYLRVFLYFYFLLRLHDFWYLQYARVTTHAFGSSTCCCSCQLFCRELSAELNCLMGWIVLAFYLSQRLSSILVNWMPQRTLYWSYVAGILLPPRASSPQLSASSLSSADSWLNNLRSHYSRRIPKDAVHKSLQLWWAIRIIKRATKFSSSWWTANGKQFHLTISSLHTSNRNCHWPRLHCTLGLHLHCSKFLSTPPIEDVVSTSKTDLCHNIVHSAHWGEGGEYCGMWHWNCFCVMMSLCVACLLLYLHDFCVFFRTCIIY